MTVAPEAGMGGSSHKGNTQRTFEEEQLSGKQCHERKNIQDEVICVEEEGKVEGSKDDDLEALQLLQDHPPCSEDHQASSLEIEPEQLHQAAAAVDIIEKVRQVREVAGYRFGDGFVAAMLKWMDQPVEVVIQALLDDNIPPSLANMDRAASLQPSTASSLNPSTSAASGGTSVQGVGGGAAAEGGGSVLAERANILDNDQFDVLKSDCVKVKGVHIKGLNEVREQLEALADDERGAGSGGRATAFVPDNACLARRGQEDSQELGDTQQGTGSSSAKSVEKTDLGKQVIIPEDGKEILGTRFLVLGCWWKGATQASRRTLYPAKCVEFDANHEFVTKQINPQNKVMTIKKHARAIKFELTGPDDQKWNTGDLWMTLQTYQEVGREYDEGLIRSQVIEPPQKEQKAKGKKVSGVVSLVHEGSAGGHKGKQLKRAVSDGESCAGTVKVRKEGRWQKQQKAIAQVTAERDALRAERDALQAKFAALQAQMLSDKKVLDALRSECDDLRAQVGAPQGQGRAGVEGGWRSREESHATARQALTIKRSRDLDVGRTGERERKIDCPRGEKKCKRERGGVGCGTNDYAGRRCDAEEFVAFDEPRQTRRRAEKPLCEEVLLTESNKAEKAIDMKQAIHFRKPNCTHTLDDPAPASDKLIRDLLNFFEEVLDKTKTGVIKTIERSNKKELGYTRETPAGLDHKKQGYTVAGENPLVEEHVTVDAVSRLLKAIRDDKEYCGYLIMYVQQEDIRKRLSAVFAEIYVDMDETPDETGSFSFCLPGGLREKFQGDFFQIFWNPGMQSCSSTHWDDTDSLLCLLQGQKTVEMAPKDAITDTWGDDAEGKGARFSKQTPNHHTVTLGPGDSLFLPKGVWHRVTSTPNSLAISLGVATQFYSQNAAKHKENEVWRKAKRAARD